MPRNIYIALKIITVAAFVTLVFFILQLSAQTAEF